MCDRDNRPLEEEIEEIEELCPGCNGSGEGYVEFSSCRSCGGSGVWRYGDE